MSSESIDKLWDCAIDVLKKLVQEEEANRVSGDEFIFYTKLYVRYKLVLNDLNTVYDSCVQIQKRTDIKLTLETLVCRIISLRTFLAKLAHPSTQSLHELFDLSAALRELKISPFQLDLLISSRLKEGQSFSTRIAKLLGETTLPPLDLDELANESTITLSYEQDIINTNTKSGVVFANQGIGNEIDGQQAAAKIQALYRGSLVRKKVSDERVQLDNFVGMSNSCRQSHNRQLNDDIKKIHKQRAQEQAYYQEIYRSELTRLKEVVLEEEGFAIQMELREERIRWITENTIAMHELPESLEDFYTKNSSSTVNDDATSTKDANLDSLKACIDVYEQRWKHKVVGPTRFKSQSLDSEMAKDLVIRVQVRADLTQGVDKKLVSNLLKIKATQEAVHKKKSPKKSKEKVKGRKSKKKTGGGKKEKQLPVITLPEVKDMLSCLVRNGFIYEYDQSRAISDFIGPFEASNQPEHDISNLSTPSAWQLRQAVIDTCILPMGSERIRSSIRDDDSVRSILFYGPEGSGKTLMMEIIAAEVGALVIHLSSTSIGNAFEGEDGARNLIHSVFTVAREKSLSPVIIYLDKCHEFFIGKSKKKVSNSDAIHDRMKRFQTDLLIYKNRYLTKKERVLIIGCSNMPEVGDMKLMKWKGVCGKAEKQGFFESSLYFPTITQTSRAMIWKNSICRKVRGQCKLDFNLLAYMSDGYSARKVVDIVDEVLSAERLTNLASAPLREHDFASKFFPKVQIQNDEQFINFRRQWSTSSNGGGGGGGGGGEIMVETQQRRRKNPSNT